MMACAMAGRRDLKSIVDQQIPAESEDACAGLSVL